MWGILGLCAMGLCWSDVYVVITTYIVEYSGYTLSIAAKHISSYYINGKQEEIL